MRGPLVACVDVGSIPRERFAGAIGRSLDAVETGRDIYCAHRDQLMDFEDRVVRSLDPPLNLDGMVPTPLRMKLSELPRRLKSG